jgi:molybdenum cofactor cytidylyltransferase
MNGGIVGVLLAAGRSRRFGSNKLLHRCDGDLPMVVAAARPLRAALPLTLAVVDDARSEVAGLLEREGLRPVVNPHAGHGMGTSIARAVAACPDADAWVIALGDMPRVPESVVRAVVRRLQQGDAIVAPVYRDRRGHPVGFSARFAPALMRLNGDSGARGVIAANPDAVRLIEVEHAGVATNIDYR